MERRKWMKAIEEKVNYQVMVRKRMKVQGESAVSMQVVRVSGRCG